MVQYDYVKNYTMKCRLYPNKECAKRIDDALIVIRVFHNCAIYDLFNKINTKEKPSKQKKKEESNYTGDTVHFIDMKSMMSASYKRKLIEKHPIINACPQGAITTNNGLVADLKKELDTRLPIEFQKPSYYTKNRTRRSYTYQERLSKIELSNNENVFYFTFSKVGRVKVRGWNKNIRFDENGATNFLDYAKKHSSDIMTITISKDACEDYWICFKLKFCFKPINEQNEVKHCGIDIGIKDIIVVSDGTKFENKRYRKDEKVHLKVLNRRLSRREGWANKDFIGKYKKDNTLQVSKGYESTKLKHAKLERQIARKRKLYNNEITKMVISEYSLIGVETLNITSMFRNKYLTGALHDASMGSVLQMLKYKADWHNKSIVAINQWTPSSKRYSYCGYIKPKLTLETREWICPKCGEHHDRDINAVRNILHYALITYNNTQ